jgi:hypothetical protein
VELDLTGQLGDRCKKAEYLGYVAPSIVKHGSVPLSEYAKRSEKCNQCKFKIS